VFTLLNLEVFNSKNVKNKKCVHTRANNTSSIKEDENLVNLSKCPQYQVHPNVSKHLQRSPKKQKVH